MYLKSLELSGFKSFARKTALNFKSPITAIVGPNGSGKSNVAEAFQFVLGEQSIKSLRGKRGEDLIFNGSKTAGRQNRASVKIALDNTTRLLDIDFDEASIERVVHRDNNNDYLINGSIVRLKDVVELLSHAHMGPTGHHIISQGEADRILNANLKERRLMIEDALGLKVYQFKRAESERKLERTRENIGQVESLRRELAPHLRFLKKQMEKIEKAKDLSAALAAQYEEYLAREVVYLDSARQALADERRDPARNLAELERHLTRAKATLEKSRRHDDKSAKVLESEKRLRSFRVRKDDLVRQEGKLDGELAAEERRLARLQSSAASSDSRTVPLREVRALISDVDGKLSRAESDGDLSAIKRALTSVRTALAGFAKRFETLQDDETTLESKEQIDTLKRQRFEIEKHIHDLSAEEQSAVAAHEAIRHEIEKEKDEGRDAEREIFKIVAQQNELRGTLNLLQSKEESLHAEEEALARERGEAEALVGQAVVAAAAAHARTGFADEQRAAQQERRRQVEKMKIRLEELGGSASEEVVKEYQEASERDGFLEREIGDLEKSASALENLIKDLTEKLDSEFKEGVRRINRQFEEFFRLMFGGGHAELAVVKEEKRKKSDADDLFLGEEEVPREEEEEADEGIIITVNLPHKKIRSLEMLSGGERALTSIALLFAISQVNPPPFIVLDETDAALDEANSKKYGDMIESLSKVSQLVLITHNRETMSRAGVLYGVTMGQDGVSKLLSIEFEEAVKVAK